MNIRSLLSTILTVILLITTTSCTDAQMSNTITIIGDVLTAGETLLPILQAGGVLPAAQNAQVTGYVNGAALLMATISAGIKSGNSDISQISTDASALNAQLAALGVLPTNVQTYVTTITSGLAAVLAALNAAPKTASFIKGHSTQVVSAPHVTLIKSPLVYTRLSDYERRAKRLASKTSGKISYNPFAFLNWAHSS